MTANPYGYPLPPTPPPGRVPQFGEPAHEYPHLTEAFAYLDSCYIPGLDFQQPSWKRLAYVVNEICRDKGHFEFRRLQTDHEGLGHGRLTILDIFKNGSMHHSTHESTAAMQNMGKASTSSMRTFVSECITEMKSSPDQLKTRTILIDLRGPPAFDLYMLDMLFGAYQIDFDFLWYAFRVYNELYGELQDITSIDPPLFLENMHIPWKRPNILTIGTIHAMFLDGYESPLKGGQPLAIMVYQTKAKNNNVYDPYSASPLKAFVSHPRNYYALIDSAIHGYLMQPYAAEAREVANVNFDNRKALLTILLRQSIGDDVQTMFDSCLKSMIQYQVAVSKAVLIGHLAEHNRRPYEEAFEPSEEPAALWRGLERLLQHLDHQYVAISRFQKKNLAMVKRHYHIDEDLDEFDHLLKEMRIVVEHQRARLDHRLNETLMRESRANLTIAQRSIKESQRSSLLTFLAFIFVPFSLTTSVFGMNLQELNQSGQKLKVFLITTAVMFVASVMVWALASTIVTAYQNFKRRSKALKKDLFEIRRHAWYHSSSSSQKRWTHLLKWFDMITQGLTLGVISGGRYDPRAFAVAELRRNSVTVEPAIKDRWAKELQYFLGVKRIPEDEDYESLWKVHGDKDRRPSF